MAKRKAVRRKRAAAETPAATEKIPAKLPPAEEIAAVKPWAILFYLCADVPPEGETATVQDSLVGLAERLAGLPLADVHVLVQVDTLSEGASRWKLVARDQALSFQRWSSGKSDSAQVSEVNRLADAQAAVPLRINTGDPREAIEFLQWGIAEAPSRHVAVVIGGWGISALHVKTLLDVHEGFGRSASRSRLRHQNLFSICHDVSDLDALEANELRNIFMSVSKRLGRKVDVVMFDAGMTAFIELAYELRDAAHCLVAANGILPDDNWPWSTIDQVLSIWRKYHESDGSGKRKGRATMAAARDFARQLATGLNEPLIAKNLQTRLAAIDLTDIQQVVGLLDHLTSTLLQHLGDWHVLNALLGLWNYSIAVPGEPSSTPSTLSITAAGSAVQTSTQETLPTIECRDLFQLLIAAEVSLHRAVPATPRGFGMRERMEHVCRVIRGVRQAVVPEAWLGRFKQALAAKQKVFEEAMRVANDNPAELAKLAPRGMALTEFQRMLGETIPDHPVVGEGEDGQQENEVADVPNVHALLLYDENQSEGETTRADSLLILLPEQRTFASDEAKRPSAIRQESYAELDFSRDAGWSFLISAIQLITWKPHVLWRLVASNLFSRNGTTRDMMLQRLFSSRSVVDAMQTQFRVLRADRALRLSIRKQDSAQDEGQSLRSAAPAPQPECEPCRGTGDREHLIVQLESAAGESVVSENTSPIYKSTFSSTVKSFEDVLNGQRLITNSVELLQRLGWSLGADVIQDLRELLDQMRSELAKDTDVAPHLRLQLDMDLMAYPWELIADGQGMLFERFALGRQFVLPLRRSFPKRDVGPLRVLVIGDPKFGDAWQRRFDGQLRQLPGAAREAESVVELFRQLREDLQGIVDVWIESHIHKSMTTNRVRSLLRSGRYEIVHFAGHACFNVDDPEGSGWLLSDGLLHAREIRNTLEWADYPPWLVYANACEAGMERADHVRYEYQTDVYGLGSAFNAHGVRGYVAPMWPIDDEVATLLASEFYCALLLDRRSLGEALYTAKQRTRQLLVGPDDGAGGSHMVPRTALSWASMVLYGDPTQRLFQTLWGGAAAAERDMKAVELTMSSTERELFEVKSPAPSPKQRRTGGRGRQPSWMPRFEQAPAKQVIDSIRSPSLLPLGLSRDLSDLPKECDSVLELVEENGIRQWRLLDPRTGKATGLAAGGLIALTAHPEFRALIGVNRSWKDYVSILGRWIVNKLTLQDPKELFQQFARQFDEDKVASEGLLEYRDGQLATVTPDTWKPLGRDERLLLFIHGTFSETRGPMLGGFGEAFWKGIVEETRRAAEKQGDARSTTRLKYRILGYDHWTLSKTPQDNADDLTKSLSTLTAWGLSHDRPDRLFEALAPESPHLPPPIDVITHSRGGLVARAFVELMEVEVGSRKRPVSDYVRNLIFGATPNAGTQLANPNNWGRAANYLVNLVHRDHLNILGPLSGFLAESFVRWQTPEIPGLYEQDPDRVHDNKSLLFQLQYGKTSLFHGQKRDWLANRWPRYHCIAANFEPGPFQSGFDVGSLEQFLKQAKSAAKQVAGGQFDTAIDAFLNIANDLVVDTHGVWVLRQPRELNSRGQNGARSSSGLQQPSEAGRSYVGVPPERVLLFNPDDALELPPQLNSLPLPWIHHCNLFEIEETRRFVRNALSGS